MRMRGASATGRESAMGEGSDRVNDATGVFLEHRNLLFTVVYEMLGSAVDAEDVLQETWLKWVGVDQETVGSPRAFLVRIATRQALTRLRVLGRRRESYVGPWLPEPLLTAPDVAEDVELAESVSMAMLLVLETLGPIERAVFVLREVFALPYGEIAAAVGKSPAAVRQIARRARTRVAERRPRTAVSAAESRAVTEAFRQATETGDLRYLLDLLAPDVVLLTDGGGIAQAARAPVVGVGPVTAVLDRIAATLGGAAGPSLCAAQVNGHPALVLRRGEVIDSVIAVRVDEGRVTGLYAVRNPEKLSRMNREAGLRR
jgi:RNA polymerase sigma-70 factor (TIGR02957 family)